MTTRRYPVNRRNDQGELFPVLVDTLLEGWSAPRRPDDADPFAIFAFNDLELRDVWRRHRAVLLEEATRRGLSRPVWAEERYELEVPPWLREPAP